MHVFYWVLREVVQFNWGFPVLSGAENKGLHCGLPVPVCPSPQSLIYQSNKIRVIRMLTKDRGALPCKFFKWKPEQHYKANQFIYSLRLNELNEYEHCNFKELR